MSKLTARELLTNPMLIMEKRFLPMLFLEKYLLAYRKIILYEVNLNDFHLATPNTQVKARRAGLNDMEKLVEMRSRERDFGEDRVNKKKYMIRVLERLNAGHWCFVAEANNKILGYSWIAFRELYDSETGRIILRKDEAMVYDAYTFSSYRGKGVSGERWRAIIDHLRKGNYRKIYFLIAEYNKPSRRAAEKINGKAKETITFLRIFAMTRLLHKPIS